MKLTQIVHVSAAMVIGGSAFGATLVQTFESGERVGSPTQNQIDWGSTWNAPAGYVGDAPGFLTTGLGGTYAGYGSSKDGQQASRDFKNNTVGLDVVLGNQPGASASSYTVSMYLQFGLGIDIPASGSFHIIDGNFGESAADIKLEGYGTGVGSSVTWQAKDGGSYVAFDEMRFSFDATYFVSYTIDPNDSLYSATVSEVSTSGAVINSQTLSDLSNAGSVFTNGNNGKLLFYIQTSAGTANFKVDNIKVTDATAVPEPATSALFAMGAAGVYALMRRRSRRAV